MKNPMSEGRRALITGAAGFTGRHLAHALAARRVAVTGLDRLAYPGCHMVDLLDRPRLQEIIEASRPEVIFHLAGLVKSDEPALLYESNAAGTAALFEAVLRSGQRPLVILVSSSAVYREAESDARISEEHPLEPATHYGGSKLAQERIARRYAADAAIPVIVCRPFNLSGPGLPSSLALGAFSRRIACAERAGEGEVRVGNLSAKRDYLDVRDAVQAYVRLAELGRPGETYNVCSGEAHSLRECLDLALGMAGGSLRVRSDPERNGAVDVPVQVGDPLRLQETTGWLPAFSIEQSLRDMLAYWRAREDACE